MTPAASSDLSGLLLVLIQKLHLTVNPLCYLQFCILIGSGRLEKWLSHARQHLAPLLRGRLDCYFAC